MRLWVLHLNLQEAFWDAVHLFDLQQEKRKWKTWFTSFALRRDRICVERKLTVCCRPPAIRCSSNKLLRANGDGVVIAEECKVFGQNRCHTQLEL